MSFRRRIASFGFTACLIAVFGCAHLGPDRAIAGHGLRPESSEPIAWVAAGPDGIAIARAIVPDSECPLLKVDESMLKMQPRAVPPADGSFPGLVCELAIPPQAKRVELGETALPLLKRHPRRILIIGDTGCRLKEKKSGKMKIQNCNDAEKGWLFPKLARAAAGLHPDLVIHVGDYHYREASCPEGNPKCAGSVAGDNWTSWGEDFFSPAQPLLAAAPWVFVRGNHESCDRAQEGFFRLLDPRPYRGACQDVTPPYAVPFENMALAVVDSSFADFTAESLAPVKDLAVQGAWLVTHRPPWITPDTGADADDDDGPPFPASMPSVSASPAAAHSLAPEKPVGVPGNLGLVINGHRHLFRAITFADHRPPQITAGNGGTKLEANPDAQPVGTPVDAESTEVASVRDYPSFGFLVLDETGPEQWSAVLHDASGAPAVSCILSAAAPGLVMSLRCE